MIPLIRYFDRSRTTTDWTCPRKRYLNYEYLGKGIVPDRNPLALDMGTIIHTALSKIAQNELDIRNGDTVLDIEDIFKTAFEEMHGVLFDQNTGTDEETTYAIEQATLVEGMLRGFYKHMWPKLLEAYPEILFLEQELEYKLQDDLIFMSKPDLVLRNPETDEIVYIEYKSTSSKKAEWVNSWNTAVQLHSTIRAVEQQHGIEINSVIVQGLYKGYESYGRQNSPFCYAYRKAGNPPFSEDQIAYDYKAGWKKFPIWEAEGGVKAWVDNMPENILTDQFPQTPPIFVRGDLINSFFRQRQFRENEISLANVMLASTSDEESKQNILDVAFPQRFDQCTPSFGKPCQYRQICHGHVPEPIGNGFKWREPHHKQELEQWKAAEEAQCESTPSVTSTDI
jgi:PD-(D/E)XK nuclease superfamily